MSQSVLVINCGSSSIKFALYPSSDSSAPSIKALAERLGEQQPLLTIKSADAQENNTNTNTVLELDPGAAHKEALSAFMDQCQSALSQLAGIGHRIVHGGESFSASTLLDDNSIAQLKQVSDLAPLHNPVNLLGVELCQQLQPGVPNVAVFDTAFHQTIPESTYLYAVPYDWYQNAGVRRYGFHGTSYRYVAQETARRLQQPADSLNLLIAHLGNGCSACAIAQGKSVDTTMGLTPLEGMVMGSRSGDIDPSLIDYMVNHKGKTLEQVSNDLIRNSGLKGLSQLSNDMRSLLEAEAEGHEGAKRAIDVFCFRVARQLAALSTSLSSIDAIVFTGGIGEHASEVRRRILASWRNLGCRLDAELNQQNGDDTGRISAEGTQRIMVVATDEELMIAQDTYQQVTHD
ncbi:acetate/propionate family kinase [Bacterioplanoides sp.]|uniref:acetate/propionate family kinase n=1 Tax=Bacterioplanoides sp. TaxID=2066072 RepID=UPI003B0085AA